MKEDLEKCLKDAVWVSHALFQGRLVTGSSGNVSFRYQDQIYISAGGSILGKVGEEDFIGLGMDGSFQGEKRPSKEFPLHLALYQANEAIGAVIHTHSLYTVLWSCISPDEIPQYTPYRNMQFDQIVRVSYAQPGSEKLFARFRQCVNAKTDGIVLDHHGIVVAGPSLLSTFAKLEEFEMSAKVAWELRGMCAARLEESRI